MYFVDYLTRILDGHFDGLIILEPHNLGSGYHLDSTNFYFGLQFVHRGIFVVLSGNLGTCEM